MGENSPKRSSLVSSRSMSSYSLFSLPRSSVQSSDGSTSVPSEVCALVESRAWATGVGSVDEQCDGGVGAGV